MVLQGTTRGLQSLYTCHTLRSGVTLYSMTETCAQINYSTLSPKVTLLSDSEDSYNKYLGQTLGILRDFSTVE